MSRPEPAASCADAATVAVNPDDPPSINAIIRAISDGVRKAQDLDPETRQDCVLALSIDGFTNEEVACLLRVSERTVTRDRKAAWKRHGLRPDRLLGDELLGEFQMHVQASLRRLSRLCNDRETAPMVRVRADEAIGRIYQRFADLVRRFSYAQDGSQRLMEQRAEMEPPMPTRETGASYEEILQEGMRRAVAKEALRVYR
jgi:hypothetical protein